MGLLPANETIPRTHAGPGLRIIAGLVTVVFLLGLTAHSAPPASARDWSGQIAVTRASQLYYESAMRYADSQVRGLKLAAKRAQRQLKLGQRKLEGAKSRRARMAERLKASRAELSAARAVLDELTPSPASHAERASLARAVIVLTVIGAEDPPSATSPVLPGVGLLAMAGERSSSASVDVDVSVEEVSTLDARVKKQARKYRRMDRRVRHIAHNVRVKARNVASVKRLKRAAISRREGAEVGLASRILSMSRLAQLRAVKHTDLRPGSNQSFGWPTTGRISQYYGCTGFYLSPRRGSCAHFHDGLDIAGYLGTPIRSMAVGIVSYIGWNPWDQGQRAFMIVVAHPGGYETLYGHVLPTRRVRVGELVQKGQVIGYMGNTGRSTGVHLHLELRRGRTTLNPLGFL